MEDWLVASKNKQGVFNFPEILGIDSVDIHGSARYKF